MERRNAALVFAHKKGKRRKEEREELRKKLEGALIFFDYNTNKARILK
jgi:hypothetical protein